MNVSNSGLLWFAVVMIVAVVLVMVEVRELCYNCCVAGIYLLEPLSVFE